MKFIVTCFSLLFTLYFLNEPNIQGKWKLVENESFLNILTSETYNTGSDEQKTKLAEIFQFVLDSTYYTFKEDSVFFTDAGPGGIVNHKSGKWLIKEDTLFILESGKFKTHKYLIHSLNDKELKVNLVLSNVIVSKSLLTFKKVE